MQTKQRLAIVAVLAVTAMLAGGILYSRPQHVASEHEHGHDEPAHQDAGHETHAGHADEAHAGEEESAKGPHGGKIFHSGDYAVEISMLEQGGEPRFLLYSYLKGKPLPPTTSKISVVVTRLGRAEQPISWVAERDFLKSREIIAEPHSFAVNIVAEYGGKQHRFAYEQEEARIRMSDAQLRENDVSVLQAGPAMIADRLPLAGEIHVDADRSVQIVPRVAGVVEQVPAVAGSVVRKGQLLAVLSSPALADMRAEWLAAQKRLELARVTFRREQQLWQERISAEQDYLLARNALQEAEINAQSAQSRLAALGAERGNGKQLARYEIRSPIDGTVTHKQIVMGESLKDDAPIFTITDLSRVWAEATVPARDLPRLKAGQTASVKASAYEASGSGHVVYVSSALGEQSRNAIARVSLDNRQGLWRPGLPVNIEVLAGETRVPLAIAAEAVQNLGDRTVAFGRYGEYLEARPLQLGRSDGKMVEVRQGLLAGERYAAKNSFLIKADIGKAAAAHEH